MRAEEQSATQARRMSRIRSRLACPICHSDLTDEHEGLRCLACGRGYPVRRGKIYFSTPFSTDDAFDSVKGWLKRALGRCYYSVGIKLIGPSYPFNFRKKILSHVDPDQSVVVDLGAGNHRLADSIVTLDGIDYDAVDIVADVTSLPFKDGSIDCFTSRSVLEHVPEVHRVIGEIRRCTRPAGLSIHYTPFLFPYHASPHDYQRFTHTGIAHLFKEWSLVEQENTGGPISLLLIIVIELVSTLFGFGNQRIKLSIYLLLCLLLFPLKFLDMPFIGRKSMLALAPTMVSVVRNSSGRSS